MLSGITRGSVVTLPTVVALAAVAGSGLAASGAHAASSGKRPTIASVSPTVVAPGDRMTIVGTHFVRGRLKNTVVFLGGAGSADDVTAKVTAGNTRRITLRAPRARTVRRGGGAVSGRVRLVNRNGRSTVTRMRVQFDNDRDGLTNEGELSLGTDPTRRDSDGDGILDSQDSAPLTKLVVAPLPTVPSHGVTPSPAPSPDSTPTPTPPRVPAPVSTTLATPDGAPADAAGVHPALAHGHYTGSDFSRYILKRRPASGDEFEEVAASVDAENVSLVDGTGAAAGDWVYRTDVATEHGVAVGSEVTVRIGTPLGGYAITPDNASLGLTLMQTSRRCDACGAGAVRLTDLFPGALALSSTGGTGGTVGATAVMRRTIALDGSTDGGQEIYTRAFVGAPSGSSNAAQLSLSAVNPAAALGDVTGAGDASVTVELRRTATAYSVRLLEGGQVVASETMTPTVSRPAIYLSVMVEPTGTYAARFRQSTDPIGTYTALGGPRPLPAGMTAAWLSLSQAQPAGSALAEVWFDELKAEGGGIAGGYAESFTP